MSDEMLEELSDRDLLVRIAKDSADTRQDIAAVLSKVNTVIEDLKPTLDQVMKSPMLKMLGVK